MAKRKKKSRLKAVRLTLDRDLSAFLIRIAALPNLSVSTVTKILLTAYVAAHEIRSLKDDL
jgi:hypothetical protein